MKRKIKEIIDSGKDLIQMYQAGFTDGTGKKWAKIKDRCAKAFEKRFMKKHGKKKKM